MLNKKVMNETLLNSNGLVKRLLQNEVGKEFSLKSCDCRF